jgi:hypothetical protein
MPITIIHLLASRSYAAGNAIDAQMANFLDGMAKTVEKK